MKKIPVMELVTSPRAVWVMTASSGPDTIRFDRTETAGNPFLGIYINFSSPYRLPGLVVQALAQLEQYNGLRAEVEVKE